MRRDARYFAWAAALARVCLRISISQASFVRRIARSLHIVCECDNLMRRLRLSFSGSRRCMLVRYPKGDMQ